MDLPKPEYVKSFVSRKIKKKDNQNSLLENDELARGTHENQRSGSSPDHIEMSNRVYSQSEDDAAAYNSKSPLQHKGVNTKHYGTTHADAIAVNSTSTNRGAMSLGADDGGNKTPSPKSSSYEGHSENHDHDHDHSHSSTTSLDSGSDSDHCHEDDGRDEAEKRKRKKALRKIIIATILCFLFMCGEILGGYLANSLAIMTDASHLLTDVSSFLVSIIALRMAAKPSSPGMTFGWHRAEVIGAITSVLTIWILTGILVYFAVQRLITNDYELDGMSMLITASCAVIFNVIMGAVLHEHGHGHIGHAHSHSHSHSHSHKQSEDKHQHNHDEEGGLQHDHSKEHNHSSEESGNVNVRAAFIHVVGDLLQSIGVLIAAFIVYFKPEYKIADPICTFLFSFFVLATTITVLRDTIVVIMEGKPTGIEYEKVKENLLSLEGVVAVHDLRIWSLTLNQIVMSCHLAIGKQANSSGILKLATKKMKSLYDFHSMTIQVEQYSQDMEDCKKCKP